MEGERLGNVGWSVVDTDSGRELCGGETALSPGDIAVDEHTTAEGVTYFRKSVQLCPPFSFSIDEHPGRSAADVGGFLFKGERTDVQAFSSEWFNVTGPSEATKLQEEGKLAISIAMAARGWEVIRTEFLTDVSLRITRFDGDPSKEPSTRILIRKGSWIEWPEAA